MWSWHGLVSFIDRRRWAQQADKLPTQRLLFLPIHTCMHILLRCAIDFLPWLRTYSLLALKNLRDRKERNNSGIKMSDNIKNILF